MANRKGKVETVTDFIFLGSKVTVDGDYSHEIKRCLLLGRKAMTSLDSTLKSRDITWMTKVIRACWGFPGSSASKESACNAGGPVQFLGREVPLEKG